jgi:hypothetical protein
MKAIKIAIFFLSYALTTSCSIASSNTPNNDSNSWASVDLAGRWSPDCERISGINIHDYKKIIIEINSNQIYILATGTITGNILAIALEAPEDLGRGGMMLEWDNFSKTIPIAKMELISESTSTVEWLGFYNDRLKSRAWLNEPDFLTAENKVFSKCKDQ